MVHMRNAKLRSRSTSSTRDLVITWRPEDPRGEVEWPRPLQKESISIDGASEMESSSTETPPLVAAPAEALVSDTLTTLASKMDGLQSHFVAMQHVRMMSCIECDWTRAAWCRLPPLPAHASSPLRARAWLTRTIYVFTLEPNPANRHACRGSPVPTSDSTRRCDGAAALRCCCCWI